MDSVFLTPENEVLSTVNRRLDDLVLVVSLPILVDLVELDGSFLLPLCLMAFSKLGSLPLPQYTRTLRWVVSVTSPALDLH
jgi:hypothetical protein